ncbi:MAG: hypothetical protein FJW20_06205 [Acidimicrobiia bacterium]|nr:hypothetical protein [Acidimicrobiia bacterium]
MKRVIVISLLVFAILLLWAQPVAAQVSSVRVIASNPGARFRVDGTEFWGTASFLWPRGSKHILEFPADEEGRQLNALFNTRYRFNAWNDNKGLLASSGSRVVTVTADPEITTYNLTVTTEYRVLINFFNEIQSPSGNPIPTVSPAACGTPGNGSEFRPGLVFVNGVCYWGSVDLWVDEGEVTLNAFPFPGFVFVGWAADTRPPDPFLRTLRINRAMVIHPRFSPAKRVTFRTNPPGFKVRVDRAEISTTDTEPCIPAEILPPYVAPLGVKPLCLGEFDFLPGSSHLIGAPSPQQDQAGRTWIFDGFSNGLGNNDIYVTPTNTNSAELIIARFSRGVGVSFATNPPGLKINVNGRDNWPSLHFFYAPGSRQTASAPSEQEFQGRKYVFRRWSNGGSQTQEIAVPNTPDAPTLQITAEYDLLSQVVIRSQPAGVPVTVDGAACPTPCRIDRTDGTDVRLAAPSIHSLSDVHRMQFVSWSDNSPRERTLKLAGPNSSSATMNFVTAFRLLAAADPPEAARFTFDPPSPDGYFPEGSFLTVTAGEAPGFKFRRWDIDIEGTSRTSTLHMSKPRTILARYDQVPFVSPAGIRNAAAETPDGLVAPGSLITVFGANLASRYEVGPSSPLSQSLAGVSITVGNRILPLLFVSPDQINAQLPRDLAPGEHTLVIKRVGQPDVSGKFTVAVCAPGLFSQTHDSQAFALAQHEDGSPITPSSPARRGELVTLFGTGFGRYTLNAPEGFAIPSSPAFTLDHAVLIEAGDARPESLWAGAATGFVGMDVVRFRVGDDMSAGANLQLIIQVDGHRSNTVLLPVE